MKQKCLRNEEILMELESMSRKELESLRRDVDRALQSVSRRELKAAREAAAKAAAEHGFSLAEVAEGIGAKPARSGGSMSPAKYANPDDPTQTWTGKGRQPNWYRDAVAKGIDPEKLAL